MLLGLWKNIEDLEMHISLKELETILQEARAKEERHHRFLAAIQGIDLDKHAAANGEDRVEAAKRRIAAMQAGKSKEEADFMELDMDYEIEE